MAHTGQMTELEGLETRNARNRGNLQWYIWIWRWETDKPEIAASMGGARRTTPGMAVSCLSPFKSQRSVTLSAPFETGQAI